MSFRFALKPYITSPESYKDEIIYQDDNFVVMKDGFPKSVIHYLILPRDLNVSKKHPLVVFKDEKLREQTGKIVEKIKKIALDTLKRDYGIVETEDFIQVGVHSVPSMCNLHIHVITKDFNSERMKNKNHYNSFTTDFFVKFDDLPLGKSDSRLDPKEAEKIIKTSDIKCAYCGENFTNKFVQLKKHLTMEFDKKYKSRKRKIEVIEID